MSKSTASKPIEIKISTVVAVAALLHEADPSILEAALKNMTGGVPDYFDNEFTVIDLGGCDLANRTIDWPALITLFKSHNLNPVAVRHAPAEMEAEIIAHGLSIDVVAQARHQPEPAPEAPPVAEALTPAPAPPAPAAAPAFHGTMIIDTPVRAGQRIYARGADLVVMAVVNNGAELIADGSIHIYAPLRGRALAGASGDVNARVFALSMEAELVSIAGMYRTFENGLPKELVGKSVQVRLVGDRIDIAPIAGRT